MESLLIEQSLTPRKQIRNSKWKTHQHVTNNINNPHHLHQIAQFSNNNNISRQGSLTQNYAPPLQQQQPPQVMMNEFELMMMMMHGGSFFNNHQHAPSYHHHHVSNSLPPIMSSSLAHHHQPTPHPLPVVSRPAFRSLPPLSSRKTPTKHKTSPKKENKKGNDKNNNNNNNNSNSVQLSAAKHVKTKATISNGPSKESGPNHETLAKDLTQMLLADLDDEIDRFSGSVFSLAPPASSLPFPKFVVRRQPTRDKLSCNSEAAADVSDGGASNNLSKLLKLR